MKARSFFTGLSWLLLLNILVKPIWLLMIDRQVQLTVGHEVYGGYFALLGLSYVLLFLTDAGLTNMMNQKLANGEELSVQQLFRIKLLLSVIYIITLFFFAWLTGVRNWNLLLLIAIIQVLTSFFVFMRAIITGHQHYSTDAVFSVLDKLLMILSCLPFLYFAPPFRTISMELFLQIQVLATGVALGLGFIFLAKRNLLSGGKTMKLDFILRSTAPFALIILLMATHYRADGFLLERLHPSGLTETGIYATAYRLLDISNMAGYLVASFLVPFVARHQQDQIIVEEAVLSLRRLLMLIAIPVACFACTNAGFIQEFLYHSNDPYQSRVIALCLCSLPGYFLVHIYGSVLTATARFSTFISLLVVTVAINLALNFILIPRYGAEGASIAALSSQYFCGLSCLIMCKYKVGFRMQGRGIWLYPVLTVVLIVYFIGARMAMINVWLILALAAVFVMLLLARQAGPIKKYFTPIR